MERLYSIKEVSEALKVSIDFVLKHARWQGRISTGYPPLHGFLMEDDNLPLFRDNAVSKFLDEFMKHPRSPKATRID